jgi:hypothetical protein
MNIRIKRVEDHLLGYPVEYPYASNEYTPAGRIVREARDDGLC